MSMIPQAVPTVNRYVAYYRVSTDRQGRSGLGLEAQRQAVAAYVWGLSATQRLLAAAWGMSTGSRPSLRR